MTNWDVVAVNAFFALTTVAAVTLLYGVYVWRTKRQAEVKQKNISKKDLKSE